MNQKLRGSIITFIAALIALTSAFFVQRTEGATMVTVRPTEDTTTVLLNPMTGFQSGSTHSPDYPFSTGYLRAVGSCKTTDGRVVTCGPLNWDRLNPARGVYNFADIDLFLSNMKDQKKVAGLRIRNVEGPGSAPKVPTWAAAAGVTVSKGREPFGGASYTEIDYHKCAFLDLWDDLVAELVRRYDNHPQVAFVDIGSYGFYGEWFSGKTVLSRYPSDQTYDSTDPTFQQSLDTRTRIVRMFTGGSGTGKCIGTDGLEKNVAYSYVGFKNKPVLISRGDQEDVLIGIQNKAGIRFDAVGAADGKMDSFRRAVGTYVAQTWRTKPIMGEFGSNSYSNHNTTDFVTRSLCFAREFHLTSIHDNFESKLSVDMNPLWRELGYRLVLTQVTYPTAANTKSNMTMTFSWVNKGTAPAYTKYPLHIYFKPAGQQTVAGWRMTTATDITKILPADVTVKDPKFLNCPKGTPATYTVTETFLVPPLTAGQYEIWIGFVDPTYGRLIQLAMSQRDITGRTYIGRITINPALPTAPSFEPKQ